MPWIKPFIALLFLSAGCSPETNEGTQACSKEQALVAENSVGRIDSWLDLERFFETHASCDDGLIAEGLSDRVGILLERDLDQFLIITRVASKREFRQFVIKHLDESLNEETLHSILRLTRNCPRGDREVCERLRVRTEGALNAL